MGADNTGWKTERLSHWLVVNWAKSFADVVAALDFSGSAGEIQLSAREPNPDSWQQWEEALWFDLAVNIAEGAVISVGCAKAAARQVAALITGDDEVDDETAQETHVELLNQVASSISSVVTEKLGRRVEFSAAAASSQPPDAELGVEYTFVVGDNEHLLVLVPNDPFVEALNPAETQQPEVAEAASAGTGGSASVPADTAARDGSAGSNGEVNRLLALGSGAQRNLAMLLEIELELSVSFGHTELPLQEILQLASGSIVELDRSVTDPVDVMVNNCVIARGDVVVVEGNYGIRVTEIVSRQERIRSIF